jgi:hypothetical protein
MPPNTLHDPQHILQKLEDHPCGSITLDVNAPQQGKRGSKYLEIRGKGSWTVSVAFRFSAKEKHLSHTLLRQHPACPGIGMPFDVDVKAQN